MISELHAILIHFVHFYFYLSIYISISLSIYLSINLYISSSIYQSLYLFIYLSTLYLQSNFYLSLPMPISNIP